MEFLEGETLAKRLNQGKLPEEEARAIARQLCAGLAEAHRNHVIHGDLKTGNVILSRGPDGAMRAVITDFGLARAAGNPQRTAQSGPLGGTPDYMAPELWKGGKATVASDIFALGVILYELVSGRRPHQPVPGPTHTTLTLPERPWQERQTQAPPPVDPRWDRVLGRCLDPDPARRYKSADEVDQALAPRSRRWLLAMAAALALATLSGVVTYERTAAPQELVRLAILPFESDADTEALTQGLLIDTGDRLSHTKPGRARLTVIPLGDAIQNKVDQPTKALPVLGATHALHGVMRKDPGNGHILVFAYLTDTRTRVRLKEWRGDYQVGDFRNMPVAMAGMVTETLRLPPLTLAATVNAAAYPDYSAGVSLARSNPGVDRALALLERAVAADPDSPLTYAKLAEAEFLKYQLTNDAQWKSRALASLKNAEQRNPDVTAVRFVSGMLNDDDGRYEEARADFERAIELDPMNADAWRRLGKAYENDNQPAQALASYQKATEIQPQYFRNYQELGAFYFNRGDYGEAVSTYKRMVQLAPDLAAAHYALSTPYLNMGRYADAEYELHVAISFQETAFAVEGLGLSLMNQSREREAIPYLQRALAIGPQLSLFYINLGSAYRRAGFPAESEQAYRKALALSEARLAKNPRDAYERSCLAYLCARLGDRRRAESEVVQAVQLSRGANNVRWMAALTYESLAMHDSTLALIRDAPQSLLARLARHPDVADLRGVPRFQQLLSSYHIQ